jgi:hypothetical protein
MHVIDFNPSTTFPPASVPSPAPGFQNFAINATDPRITYTSEWKLGTSTCDKSQQSKKTETTNQALSLNTQDFSGKSLSYLDYLKMTSVPSCTIGSGSSIYVDFSQKSASFDILIGGQSAIDNVDTLKNCTFNGPIMLNAAADIKILVFGLKSGEANGTDWWFEFNSFLCVIVSFTSRCPTEMLIQHH